MTNYFETPGDTGVTQTDDLFRAVSPTIADTLTQSETLNLVTARTIADTLSFSDYIGAFSRRVISDTLTFSDTPVRLKRAFRTITDTGSTVSSQFVVKSFRLISTTGATISDSTGAYVVPAPDALFTYLCSRNWNYIENENKWTTNAYARFTYTTIAD